MVQVLLDAGCGLNRADLVGASPLITAVRQGHVETVRLLASHRDIDLEWTDNERCTPLIVASQLGHQHLLQRLIAAGIRASPCSS